MIIAEKIEKSYRERKILHGIDLRVERGEFLSIMGKSGSGKSTLLNILAGNLRPDTGDVRLDGLSLVNATEQEMSRLRRTKLGFVYQSLNLISTLNARDNILLPIYLDRGDLKDAKERMDRLAEYMGVGHLLSSYPETMSGGEQQRVAIARAMVHEPSVLMLDEPTGSLDSRSTKDVMELLCDLNRNFGMTVIQVTHSTSAAEYGTRTLHISDGRVVDV